ncbi:hypothetical protein D9M69_542580 [compost metagenome]
MINDCTRGNTHCSGCYDPADRCCGNALLERMATDGIFMLQKPHSRKIRCKRGNGYIGHIAQQLDGHAIIIDLAAVDERGRHDCVGQ